MSEAGKKTLLLEQGGPSYYVTGGRARPKWLNGTELSRVDVPGLYKSIFSNSGEGNLTCASDVVNAFQGCTVGGNSAINAGLFFQPPASDWNRYFPDGWKDADMQSAIKKVRTKQPSTDSPSQDGKRYLQSGYEAAKRWLVDGAGYADVGLNDGIENHNKTKVFGHPIWYYENGQRSGPVKTYLQSALNRTNFSFQTGTRWRCSNRCRRSDQWCIQFTQYLHQEGRNGHLFRRRTSQSSTVDVVGYRRSRDFEEPL